HTRFSRDWVQTCALPIYLPSLSGVALEVSGVHKRFGGLRALDGVTLTAQPGRITGLIGPNGSGKTTLLNMVCGYYRVDAGTIRLGRKSGGVGKGWRCGAE